MMPKARMQARTPSSLRNERRKLFDGCARPPCCAGHGPLSAARRRARGARPGLSLCSGARIEEDT
eukprot:604587-Alexandrium_andersonii.AAC.1